MCVNLGVFVEMSISQNTVSVTHRTNGERYTHTEIQREIREREIQRQGERDRDKERENGLYTR